MPDQYPDGNPKTVLGMAKPALRAVPPVAIYVMGQAMLDGERKYERFNWRGNKVTASVYYDAALRHLMAWFEGENNAQDSGVHHLGHVMACCAILLDAEANGSLNDDRVKAVGPLIQWLKDRTTASKPAVTLTPGAWKGPVDPRTGLAAKVPVVPGVDLASGPDVQVLVFPQYVRQDCRHRCLTTPDGQDCPKKAAGLPCDAFGDRQRLYEDMTDPDKDK